MLPRIAKLIRGGMGERLKPVVLKTTVRGTVPGVRIPLPPFYTFWGLKRHDGPNGGKLMK